MRRPLTVVATADLDERGPVLGARRSRGRGLRRRCEKDVYNLSAMAREDAEQLLREHLGHEVCVRFYPRADGTIRTEDCPVGVKKAATPEGRARGRRRRRDGARGHGGDEARDETDLPDA